MNNYLSLIAKIYSIKTPERKFTLFNNYILYEPINCPIHLDKYKFLTKDISEIILTSEFYSTKFISKTILISLSNNNPEILTMVNCLKANYSNKIIKE